MKDKELPITVTILLIILTLPNILIWYNINSNDAKQVMSQYDRLKHDVISKREMQNYDGLIKNEEMKQYTQLRDQYNLEWYEKTDEKMKCFGFGAGYKNDFLLFHTFILHSKPHDSIQFTQNPVIRQCKVEYDRITIFKKYKGNWYIEKDIVDYNDDIKLAEILDTHYIQKQINKYEKWLNNIDTIVEKYLKEKKNESI